MERIYSEESRRGGSLMTIGSEDEWSARGTAMPKKDYLLRHFVCVLVNLYVNKVFMYRLNCNS